VQPFERSGAAGWLKTVSRKAGARLRPGSLRRLVSRLHRKLDQQSRRLDRLREESARRDRQSVAVDKGTQILLVLKYRELADNGVVLLIREVEFRNFSQSGEDGILLYIFSFVGTTNRRVVEICAGSGFECISANLITQHGWHALLVDGSQDNVSQGTRFFAEHPDSCLNGPVYVHSWVDRDNIDALLLSHGFGGEVDLLTVDIDGIDYWLWEAITAISPRVVVVEVNMTMSDASVTVPYRPDFEARWVSLEDGEAGQAAMPGGTRHDFFSRYVVYIGASLPAFVKLARRKGYRLVGSNAIGYNAIFLRDDVGVEYFPEVSASSCVNRAVGAHSPRAVARLSEFAWEEV
jgi:hypothetical protein